ncbi:WD40 repeat domain-containing protein [Ekhidna sp.]|jgi:WD40 repeat protein|uniref:WD40 repeat domain-containing protein n=1 Tax=Ekhidna sp. TaxID=2608089 RepID=UPI0032ED89A2
MRFLITTTLLSIAIFTNAQTSQTTTELVMSMSQRSLVMPGYQTELKALVARQAYEFWKEGNVEPYVSHLNVYQSLYEANKYLGYDSVRNMAYNQVGVHSNTVTSVVFGNEENHYYSSSTDGKILKWDLANPRAIPETAYESDKIIQSIEMSNDGKVLMAIFYQEGLALIPTEKNPQEDIQVLEDPQPVQAATFIPGERKYLMVAKTGELILKGFDAQSEQVGKTALKVNQLKVDEQDGTIYAGTEQGVLEAWEKPYKVKESPIDDIMKNWRKQSYFGYELGSFAINCLDISPDGNTLAIGRDRGDVILWDIPNKNLIRIISGHQSTVTDIQFNPKGDLLLTTSRDGTARIWDLTDSRKLPIILNDHDDWVFTGSFNPTGTQVITGGGDEFIRTWPVDPAYFAFRICAMIQRPLSPDEWDEFVGKDIPYSVTCSD